MYHCTISTCPVVTKSWLQDKSCINVLFPKLSSCNQKLAKKRLPDLKSGPGGLMIVSLSLSGVFISCIYISIHLFYFCGLSLLWRISIAMLYCPVLIEPWVDILSDFRTTFQMIKYPTHKAQLALMIWNLLTLKLYFSSFSRYSFVQRCRTQKSFVWSGMTFRKT